MFVRSPNKSTNCLVLLSRSMQKTRTRLKVLTFKPTFAVVTAILEIINKKYLMRNIRQRNIHILDKKYRTRNI